MSSKKIADYAKALSPKDLAAIERNNPHNKRILGIVKAVKKDKARHRRRPSIKLQCSDCGHLAAKSKPAGSRTKQRCTLCGGPMNFRWQA